MNKRHFFTTLVMVVLITLLHYYLFSNRMVFHDLVRIFYYIPIVYGAFVYRLKGGVIISSIVVILYAPHLIMYFGVVNFEVVYQLLELLMFILAGLGIGYLVEKDHIKRMAIERQVVKITDLENYNHNILDSIESGIVAFDSKGKLKFVNHKANEEFKGLKYVEKFLKQYCIEESIEDVLHGGTEGITREINHKEESYELSCMPIMTINKDIEGVVVSIKNITMMKALEEQVRRGDRLSAVGNLAAGIAHEIRNPLGIIKTISQTLQSGENHESENLKEGLEIIDHEINRANDVVKWLLDFAKPEQYSPQPINLSEVINQLSSIFSKYSEKKSVDIKLNNKDNIWTYGDQEKLKQAFVNLMLNGIESISGNGIMDISLKVEDYNCVLQIIDSGCGIKQEITEKIFNPFFTTKEKGTGLGLSITHKIIEQHKGKLKIESVEGKGTKVMVYLPLYEGDRNEE
ncbi:sensor histidine kinase [Alkalicella caledoniensis]|uniref:histidine kinase n=1 Tax=Alkalicella caledoniensis TaxID=2731377 RepID=A0A7G9WBJ9_ALKCA|nr:ATP-binding protein [Alkalicella caledoniensis]QNO16061.1 sensor histidine kinase [Alkalicella caledoniensis]